MPDLPVSGLTALASAGVAADDLLYIVDTSAGAAGSKKIDLNDVLDAILRVASTAGADLQILFRNGNVVEVKAPGSAAGTGVQVSHDATNGQVRSLTGQLNLGGASAANVVQVDVAGLGRVYFNTPWVSDSSFTWYLVNSPAGTFRVRNDGTFGWSSSVNAYDSIDTGFERLVAGVVGLCTANDGSGQGWVQNTAGRAVLTADVTNDSATLATTGLTRDVKAGRKCSFLAQLPVTTGAPVEGVKVAMAGTATITNLIADIEVMSHAGTPVFTLGRTTAFDSAIGQTVADAGNATVEIRGSIEVNAAGTLRIDFAKNADTGAAVTTVKRGAWFWVEDMP